MSTTISASAAGISVATLEAVLAELDEAEARFDKIEDLRQAEKTGRDELSDDVDLIDARLLELRIRVRELIAERTSTEPDDLAVLEEIATRGILDNADVDATLAKLDRLETTLNAVLRVVKEAQARGNGKEA